MTEPNFYPVSLFRLSGEDDTRENQAERAITWLCKQSGGDITVIIPNVLKIKLWNASFKA